MARALNGIEVLITAGPTYEFLDDVRYLGNPSTGRMGIELAETARVEGANVTMVMGPTHLMPSPGIAWVKVVSAEDMLLAVSERFDDCDVLIASAAVSDYRPAKRVEGKIKKGAKTQTMKLVKNPDILKTVAKARRPDQTIVGFSLEATDLLKNARTKLKSKHCDLMVVNTPGHFGDELEHVTILNEDGVVGEVPPSGKKAIAQKIIELVTMLRKREQLAVSRSFGEEE